MSHELWLRQAYEALAAMGEWSLANTCSQASVAFATLQRELDKAKAENELLHDELCSDCCLKFDACTSGCTHLVTHLRAELATRQSCVVSSEYVLVEDMDEGFDPRYGKVLICTRNCIKSALAGQPAPKSQEYCQHPDEAKNNAGECQFCDLPQPKTGGTV